MYGEEENSKVLLLRHSIQFFHKHLLNEYHYAKQRKTWWLLNHKQMCCFDSVQLLEAYNFHFKKPKTTELASSPQRDISFLWVTRSDVHLFKTGTDTACGQRQTLKTHCRFCPTDMRHPVSPGVLLLSSLLAMDSFKLIFTLNTSNFLQKMKKTATQCNQTWLQWSKCSFQWISSR
jgi:hypothetical protein